MPPVTTLIGSTKARTDLLARETRIHWNEATTVDLALNRKLVFTFPAHPGGFLDLSSMHFSAIFKRTSNAATLDATSLSQLFHRVVLRHGNVVIGDLDAYSLLVPTLEKVHTTTTVTQKERLINNFIQDQSVPGEVATFNATFDGAGTRYNIYFLRGTVFNTQALIPIDRIQGAGPLQLELYLEDPRLVVNSTTPTDNFSLNDLDLYCNYMFSTSLSSASDWKVNFNVDSYEFRYQHLGAQLRHTLRLPSAVSDLQEVLIGIRDTAGDARASVDNVGNKLQNFIGYQNIDQWQMFVESRPWFSEILTGDKTQLMLWKETRKSEPAISYSRFFTDYERAADNGTYTQPPIILCLQAAPKFADDMLSGISTHRHTVESYVDFTFKTLPTATTAAFCWMKHTVRVYQDQFGQLHVSK